MSLPASSTSLISSVPDLQAFVATITTRSTLYVDLEGHKLSRNGTLAIVTLLLHPQRVVKVIDVTTMKETAFTTQAGNGESLKSILENPAISKGFWDVRNDADAL